MNSLTGTQSTPTPVQQSNASAALPGSGGAPLVTANPIAGPAMGPVSGGNALLGTPAQSSTPTTMVQPAPAPVQQTAAPAQPATPPTPPVTKPAEPEQPSWASFLDQRNISYGWSSPVSRGVEGAKRFNPMFGTRLARAVADGEAAAAAAGAPVSADMFTDMDRPAETSAQYYADYRGLKNMEYAGKTYTGDPSRRGRMAAPPPGYQGAVGSRHNPEREDMPLGTEAADFSSTSPFVRDYVKRNAAKYGLENVQGDEPHIQLNRNIAMTDYEAEDFARKMGYRDIAEYQAGNKDAQGRPLAVDGVVGPRTRESILANMANTTELGTATAYADTLKPEDRGVLSAINDLASAEPANERIPTGVKFNQDLAEGRVPYNELPYGWRTELENQFGPSARKRYESAVDSIVPGQRGWRIMPDVEGEPEMWGDGPEEVQTEIPADPAEASQAAPEAKAAPKAAPAAEAAPEPVAVPQRVLQPGSKGKDVAAYQMMLAGMGFYKAGIDGSYGRRTANAVKALQAAIGLQPDGKIGPLTGPQIEALWAQKLQRPVPPAPVEPGAPALPVDAPSRLEQAFTRGGPVRPVTPEERAAVLSAPDVSNQIMLAREIGNGGNLGNDLTAMSLQGPPQGGNELVGPIGNEAAVNRGAKGDRLLGPGPAPLTPDERALLSSFSSGAQSIRDQLNAPRVTQPGSPPNGMWGQPMPGAVAQPVPSDFVRGPAVAGGKAYADSGALSREQREAIALQQDPAYKAWAATQGTAPAAGDPAAEARLSAVEKQIDSNTGPAFTADLGGDKDDAVSSVIRDNAGQPPPEPPPEVLEASAREEPISETGETASQRLERLLGEADEAPAVGITGTPSDRLDQMLEGVPVPEEEAPDNRPMTREAIGEGMLRGVEDTVATVADALGWSRWAAVKVLEDAGVFEPGASESNWAKEQARRDYAATGPATDAITPGPSREGEPGYELGRVGAQIGMTAAPILGSARAATALAKMAPVGREAVERAAAFLTGKGGLFSKAAAGAGAGAEAEALTSAKSQNSLFDQMASGAVFGAVGGPAFYGLGKALGAAGRGIGNRLLGGETFSPETLKTIGERIAATGKTPAQIAREARANPGASFDDIVSPLSPRMKQGVEQAIGPRPDYRQVIETAKKAANTEAATLRATAEMAADDSVLEGGRVVTKIAELSGQPQTRATKNALRQIDEALHDADGNVRVDVKSLMQARDVVDEIAKIGANKGNAAIAAVKEEIDGLLRQVPELRKAGDLTASTERMEAAGKLGETFLAGKAKIAPVAAQVRNMGPEEKRAFEAAVGSNLWDSFASAANGDLRGVQKLANDVDLQARVRVALPKQQAESLIRSAQTLAKAAPPKASKPTTGEALKTMALERAKDVSVTGAATALAEAAQMLGVIGHSGAAGYGLSQLGAATAVGTAAYRGISHLVEARTAATVAKEMAKLAQARGTDLQGLMSAVEAAQRVASRPSEALNLGGAATTLSAPQIQPAQNMLLGQ